MSSSKFSKEAKQEINRLTIQVSYWKNRVSEMEEKLGQTLPVLVMNLDGKPVRFIVHDGSPLVLSADSLAHISGIPKHYKGQGGTGSTARLRRVGLGAREALIIDAVELAAYFLTSPKHLCAALGISTKVRAIGFITPLGIETLRPRAPKFCAWVESEAFPAVLERFGKGGVK